MPVHSREKKENNHEDMDVDYPENEGSSTDEEDTESSSVSEDGDSSGGCRPKISTHAGLTGQLRPTEVVVLQYLHSSSSTQRVSVFRNPL